MNPETINRGPIEWYTYHRGMRGGIIRARIQKNRMSFVKSFCFNGDESYNIALRILRDKVARILHLKNTKHPSLGRLAQYAIDSTNIIEITREEFQITWPEPFEF